jgi:hypothetical protein
MRLDGEAGCERVQRGIGRNLRGIKVEFSTPDQPGLLTLFNDALEEALEDDEAVPVRVPSGRCGSGWSGLAVPHRGRSRDTIGH